MTPQEIEALVRAVRHHKHGSGWHYSVDLYLHGSALAAALVAEYKRQDDVSRELHHQPRRIGEV